MLRNLIPFPTPQDATTQNELDRDAIFDVLSNRRRRYILHYLKQRGAGYRATLREVVDQVAAWENNTSVQNITSQSRKRVYTAIRQSPLPKLDKVGVVDYDQQRGELTLTQAAREIELYLEYVPERDINWSEYYLSLSAICIALAAMSYFGIFVFGAVSGQALAGVVVSVFAASSVVHTYYSYQHRIGSSGPPDEPS